MGHFELSCFGDGLFREHMTSLDLTVKTSLAKRKYTQILGVIQRPTLRDFPYSAFFGLVN